jgi:phosphoribosylaminoimidazole-succinocarboxamide synthase
MTSDVSIDKSNKLYEGKAKIVYGTDDPHLVIQYFKDDATAFNAKKRGSIVGKGVVNNRISIALFQLLEAQGIRTHFVQEIDERSMLIKRVEIIPLEMTVRNITAGGISRLLGIDEGIVLEQPIVEYHYKRDDLDDPLITADHIRHLGLATDADVELLRVRSLQINGILKQFFSDRQIDLVDFKLEFGRYQDEILLADEISPDTCRFWEQGTQRKLDKDRFRRDLGDVEEVYQEMLKRIIG